MTATPKLDDRTASRERAAFLAIAVATSLLALLLRLVYFWTAQVDFPIRGDVLGYWTYASNLVNHGIFSGSPADSAAVVPDSFRGPGYPFFLALCMEVAGSPEQALPVAQFTQILIGSLVAPLTMTLARQWLSRSASLIAGLAVALWPHLVVFSSTLLSETVFSVLLLSMALLVSIASQRSSTRLALLAGLLAGLGYLVNPVLLFFPLLLAGLLCLRRQARLGLFLLLGFALVSAAWGLRNANLPDTQGAGNRATLNLVQGSWPLYHDAYNDASVNEMARAVSNAIQQEEQLALRSPSAGLQSVLARFREDPGYYLSWYLLQKPWLLWDWRVRIGWGDIYFLETRNSPFEKDFAMRSLHAAFRALNPLVFGLAVLASLLSLLSIARGRSTAFALGLVALFFIYITAVHAVFQAEPRYSVAYRPFELLLAVSMISAALAWTKATFREHGRRSPALNLHLRYQQLAARIHTRR